ncbi:YheC/YheD family protein [Marinicrinis lubricantis]|uniref:YheC/YheD family protein n=1 Tax=Marinicrinis lubricantis TaxID=2086470 RepID=A0ABW1IK60_9BACL
MTKSTGKYTKYLAMIENKALIAHVPETRKYSEEQLARMLRRHKHVMVKPSGGWGGKGVLKVSAEPRGYEVQNGKQKHRFTSIGDTSKYIRKQGGSYLIVQERIPLARIGGRPYDLRVMVQRTGRSPWKVTGKLVKVAGKGYMVTNVRLSGGRVTTFENAVRQSLRAGTSPDEIGRRIDRTALTAAKQLHRHYKWIRTIGLDMALDRNGREWIIEANFQPMLSLFNRLKDKKMYHRILSYVRK